MREFRASHAEFETIGAAIAGVSLDPPERGRVWVERLALPYPLLSDVDRRAGEAFGVIRRIGIAGWNVELFRRVTALVDREGIVRALWERVRPRGHAREVLAAARALSSLG